MTVRRTRQASRERAATATKLTDEGELTQAEIAKQLGYSSAETLRQAVYRYRRDNGLKPATGRRGPKPLPPEKWQHGKATTYSNHRCRCDSCRVAWNAWVREAKVRRAARPIPEHVHGTPNGYGNYNCRCRACTTAWTEEMREDRRHRRERQTK